ncbi:ParB N-terminal domain-containing protein [Desulfobulbus rhabdoformis]|uniref:ParB N-terminal domain-containing protein n=1 Tax=Desulfobulbus rhabdoformis TaxID=34032 RepID=UPI001963CF10|nr:ParB N-terminal domain-containing protein [Desulfobulbus rhabdoformis]MBM9615519.1 ParB N-terminal domain-containing protein [Desulfobulbus rhabdoformis]
MAAPIRKTIEIKNLHFDSFNPRLPEDMNRGNEEEVLSWMLNKGDIIALMASIGATGYSSAEAVLAIPVDGKEGEYEVIEGNRRLAAVKLLNDPEKASSRKKLVRETADQAAIIEDSIPVLIYEGRQDILTYLGYRHITGVKSWGAEEKAKYLRQLYDHYISSGMEEEEAFRTISQVVATKPYYAKKTLTTLHLVEAVSEAGFWGLDRLTADDIKFSVLGTALSYNQIVDFLELDDVSDWHLNSLNQDRLKDLCTWLFQRDPEGTTKVRESRELPKLAKVVANKEALRSFKEGHSLEYASELTDEADEAFRKFIVGAYEKLEVAQSQIKRMQAPNESDLETLRDIYKMARDMGVVLKDRIHGEKEETPF